jgi:hypothetical protein
MQQTQRQQEHEQQKHHYDNNSSVLDIDKDQTYSVATVWITKQKDKNGKVKKERPTVQLPLELSKKYRMDKPFRVMFFEKSGGIYNEAGAKRVIISAPAKADRRSFFNHVFMQLFDIYLYAYSTSLND